MTKHARWTGRLWPHGGGSSSWSSRVVATVVTLVAFVAAFIAMTTVRSLRFGERSSHDAVAVIHLTPPAERAETPKPPAPARVRAPARPAPRVTSPAVPPTTATRDSTAGASRGVPTGALPIAIPLTPTTATPGAARDSGGGVRSPGSSVRGAPYAPAGVTTPSTRLTREQMDSVQKALIAGIPMAEWHRPLTPQELADVRARREPGLDPHGRAARLPGEPVYAPLMNGGYAVGVPLISIPVFGKSRAQRKADSIIDADYQARLQRLQERLAKQRAIATADSTRRDSLLRVARADSARRDSLLRVGRRP